MFLLRWHSTASWKCITRSSHLQVSRILRHQTASIFRRTFLTRSWSFVYGSQPEYQRTHTSFVMLCILFGPFLEMVHSHLWFCDFPWIIIFPNIPYVVIPKKSWIWLNQKSFIHLKIEAFTVGLFGDDSPNPNRHSSDVTVRSMVASWALGPLGPERCRPNQAGRPGWCRQVSPLETGHPDPMTPKFGKVWWKPCFFCMWCLSSNEFWSMKFYEDSYTVNPDKQSFNH